MFEATAIAHPNIALVKYWGKRNLEFNLPAAPSLSLTLGGLSTRTQVAFREDLAADTLKLDGQSVDGPKLERISNFLDLVRARAQIKLHAAVISTNDFPTGAGLASSASGFAALALAASRAAGLELSPRELSVLARRGSGSAGRSIFGGFVEIFDGTHRQIHGARHHGKSGNFDQNNGARHHGKSGNFGQNSGARHHGKSGNFDQNSGARHHGKSGNFDQNNGARHHGKSGNFDQNNGARHHGEPGNSGGSGEELDPAVASDLAYARQIVGEEHWDLRCLIAVTSTAEKAIGSTEGMQRTQATSPFYGEWVASVPADIERARAAVLQRDFRALATIAEASCLRMHASAMAAVPGIIYWNPTTVALIEAVRMAREQGLAAFFTIDAGPQVKVFCPGEAVDDCRALLGGMDGVKQILETYPGAGARVI